jgi:predicted metal-dependent phosphoesterase TrpH
MKADLHTHSTASDGSLPPHELVLRAWREGVRLLALTDHDTGLGLEEAAQTCQSLPIDFVPGIELSTEVGQKEVHILGYWLDFHRARLQETLRNLQQDRLRRIRRMAEQLQAIGLPVNVEEVLASKKDGVFGRPQMALAMVKRGYVASIEEAFARYLGIGKPAYVPHWKLTPVQAVELITDAAGLAVLAHPGLAGRDDLIPALVQAGLGGIEAYYPEHSPQQVQVYLGIARKHHLLVTAGSDFHGEMGKQHPLGSPGMPASEAKRFLAWHAQATKARYASEGSRDCC